MANSHNVSKKNTLKEILIPGSDLHAFQKNSKSTVIVCPVQCNA